MIFSETLSPRKGGMIVGKSPLFIAEYSSPVTFYKTLIKSQGLQIVVNHWHRSLLHSVSVQVCVSCRIQSWRCHHRSNIRPLISRRGRYMPKQAFSRFDFLNDVILEKLCLRTIVGFQWPLSRSGLMFVRPISTVSERMSITFARLLPSNHGSSIFNLSCR